MPEVPVPGGRLSWSLLDLTPPWVEAPPTIVMHHGIGANRHIFDGWLPALIAGYRILRFDMRGHSTSAPSASGPPAGQRPDLDVTDPGSLDAAPLGLAPLDLDRLADDVIAVMDAAGVERAHLLGESIGGTIALNAALRAPGRVMTLTVSNGAHLGASIRSVAGWDRMIRVEGMRAWSDFMMRARFHPGAITEAQHTWFAAQQATACPITVLQLLSALVGADLSPRLPTLRTRTLLLHPDDSPFIPVPIMAGLRDLVAGARLHVIGNARHGLPFSHAGVCAQIFADFLGGA